MKQGIEEFNQEMDSKEGSLDHKISIHSKIEDDEGFLTANDVISAGVLRDKRIEKFWD